MKKIRLVLKHEFRGLVKSRSFIIATLVFIFLPLFLLGIAGAVGLKSSVGKPIGYVDNAGVINEDRENSFVRYDSEELAKAGFVAGEIVGYYVVPADFVDTGEVYLYYTRSSLLSGSKVELSKGEMREELILGLTQSYLPSGIKERVSEPIDVVDVGLDASGAMDVSQASDISNSFAMALGVAFLLVVALPSGYFLTGLMDEKANKVAEILLSSVSPLQLYMGKVLGLGLAGLLQIAAITVANVLILSMVGILSLGILPGVIGGNAANADTAIGSLVGNLGAFLFPQGLPVFLAGAFLYFLLGYLLYAVVLVIVAAFCNAEKQASQYQMIFAIVWFIPVFLVMINGINTGAVVAMSIFPLTAPVAMIMRLSISVVPVWELVISIGLVVLTIGAVTWVAVRLFKSGMLVTNSGFNFRRLLGGIAKG